MTAEGRWDGHGGGGLLLGRVSGVPVVLAPSWWLFAVLVVLFYTPLVGLLLPGSPVWVAALLAGAFAILLAISVLLHEMGHCVAALRLGLPVRRVRLQMLGGVSEVVRTPSTPAHEGVVAAAGPVVSLLLTGVFGLALLMAEHETVAWVLLLQATIANGAVALFNLLPGLPLDGGRIVRAVVWGATGRRGAGTRAAVVGAGLVAAGLVVWAVSGLVEGGADQWLRLAVCVLMAAFVVTGASAEFAAERRTAWPEGLTLAELLRPVLQLPAESPVADALAAAAGRGVVLVRADGIAVGLLDTAVAERLAATQPNTPAERAAEPITADTVLLDSEPGEEIAERVRTGAAWQFLVVDEDGKPSGVLRREDLRAALTAARGR
ncbi:site-2 protease family protein [Allokutzneria multivorans]|uniref:site-2 protease family protein n=1 Tax=Allokutzneria multivorans TaxID=1142134 RepID=UPI0031ECF9F6